MLSLKGCVLAKTVTCLLFLCLAVDPLKFTVVAELGNDRVSTPVVFGGLGLLVLFGEGSLVSSVQPLNGNVWRNSQRCRCGGSCL